MNLNDLAPYPTCIALVRSVVEQVKLPAAYFIPRAKLVVRREVFGRESCWWVAIHILKVRDGLTRLGIDPCAAILTVGGILR